MQRRTNIQISTLIILLSIITIIVQFASYYFFAAFYVIWGMACLISILSCHILLEQAATYEVCFNYSLLSLFISLIIIVLSYFAKGQSLLPYSGIMLGIAVINWLIPSFHCYLRYMLDYGTKLDDYTIFYRNHSILFFTCYFGIMLYASFTASAFPWAYQSTLETANFFPFQVIATLIEDCLYDLIPLSDIFTYLLCRILLFIPYGFFVALLLRRQTWIPRLLTYFALPFVLELIQYFVIPSHFDIDDVIYALLGGILGSLLFYLSNRLFRIINGKDFMTSDTDYPFSSSALHF